MIQAITSVSTTLPSTSTAATAATSTTSGGKSFSDFLKESVSEKIDALQNYEKAVAASTSGQISELELIKAVNEADLQLSAFKNVWEKLLQKYETIIEKTNI